MKIWKNAPDNRLLIWPQISQMYGKYCLILYNTCILYIHVSLRKIALLQILQLVSGQEMLVDNIIKEENIDDKQKVWMDADQEKQLASILDETKGWRKLAQHFNFKYLLNIFEQSPTNSTLLLLNYIAVRSSFSWIFCILLSVFHRNKSLKCNFYFFVDTNRYISLRIAKYIAGYRRRRCCDIYGSTFIYET